MCPSIRGDLFWTLHVLDRDALNSGAFSYLEKFSWTKVKKGNETERGGLEHDLRGAGKAASFLPSSRSTRGSSSQGGCGIFSRNRRGSAASRAFGGWWGAKRELLSVSSATLTGTPPDPMGHHRWGQRAQPLCVRKIRGVFFFCHFLCYFITENNTVNHKFKASINN